MNQTSSYSTVRFWTWASLVMLGLVVLAGGIVRSTGSGMGCPDWPKCFGLWIPPTDISQLPAKYEQLYGAKLKGEVVFNATKTWIEYINRLVGVLTGITIFATLIASFRFLKSDKPVFWASLLAFVLVGFQGWFGSKVVSTELMPVMVTIHMLVAIVIVFVLVWLLVHISPIKIAPKAFYKHIRLALGMVIWFMLGQIVLGTQVRESIDEVAKSLNYDLRSTWIEQTGLIFEAHRSFSLMVFVLQIALVWYFFREKLENKHIETLFCWIVALIGVEIVLGIIMAYASIPAWAQPLHLFLAIALIAIQFATYLRLKYEL